MNNYEIKNDDEYQQISNLHGDLINTILKEEDNFITEHKKHIDDMVNSIKNEMNYLHEVDKPGSNIDEYTSNLDKLLSREIETITNLKSRLNKFRIMLKDENALANLFEDEEIILSMILFALSLSSIEFILFLASSSELGISLPISYTFSLLFSSFVDPSCTSDF